MIAELGYHYHWPPAVLWSMTAAEMMFWHEQLRETIQDLYG